MNLTLTLEEEISLLDRYKLTPGELFLTRCILIMQEDGEESIFSNFVKTLNPAGVELRSLLESLQHKGIILKSYKIPLKGMEFNPYDIQINKNFIKNLYKCSFELGKELFETYPQFGSINGSVISLRTVAKHFDSLEDAYFKYSKAINWNSDKHNEIVELVKWGKDNNIINCSLSSFIINRGWLDLQALKEGNNINFNTEAIKLL